MTPPVQEYQWAIERATLALALLHGDRRNPRLIFRAVRCLRACERIRKAIRKQIRIP